jgi:hypothetical protein
LQRQRQYLVVFGLGVIKVTGQLESLGSAVVLIERIQRPLSGNSIYWKCANYHEKEGHAGHENQHTGVGTHWRISNQKMRDEASVGPRLD